MPEVAGKYNPNAGKLHLIHTPESNSAWFEGVIATVREEVRALFSSQAEHIPLSRVDMDVNPMGRFDVYASPLNFKIFTIAKEERLASLAEGRDVKFMDRLRGQLLKKHGIALDPNVPFVWFVLYDERGKHL